jgi:hypothetical protein
MHPPSSTSYFSFNTRNEFSHNRYLTLRNSLYIPTDEKL